MDGTSYVRSTTTLVLALVLALVATLAGGSAGDRALAASVPAGSPIGNVESVGAVTGGIAVKGWTIDPDTTAPVYVWVTLDGAGRHLYADQPRPDVAAAYPAYGPDHGFAGTLSAAPGSHSVCITASNVAAGAHTVFGCWTLSVAAPSPAQVASTQSILAKLGLPVGPVDGVWGPQTAQGLCTFRLIAGLPVSRGGLTADDVTRLNDYAAAYASLASIPAPARGGRSTYLVATRTCQTMLYARDGHYARAMRISTGKPGYATPTGAFVLGSTRPGWSCSSLYPEACYYRSEGMNALYPTKGVPYSTYGNMYNKRTISGAYMLHGSPSVPTYPASHGCVRVTIADSDWMFGSISNAAGVVYLEIVGTY